MKFARHLAVAGAVACGFYLAANGQEKTKQAEPQAKVASPSDATPAPVQEGSKPQSENVTADPAQKTDEPAEQKPAEQKPAVEDKTVTQKPRREPIAEDAQIIQFSFATQPWENVMEWIAELAGLSLQMDVKPTGTFNYINDPRKYTLGQAMDVINAQLIPKGFALLRKGNYLRVIALAEGIPADLVPQITPEQLDSRGESEFVRVSFPVKNVLAKSAAEEVKGLAGQYGKVTALESVNRITITDTVGNVRLMRDLLDQLDGAGAGLQAKTRVFQLKYAPATKVEATLRDLLGLPPRTGATSSGTSRSSTDPREEFRERMRRMFEGGGGGPGFMMFGGGPQGSSGGEERRGGESRGGESRDRSSSQSQAVQSSVTLAVDEPHNQIFVKAPPDVLAMVEDAITRMDVPREGEDPFKPREPQLPTVKVYRLSDGDAQSLSTALQLIYQNTPGVRFSADQTNNAVVAVATPDDQKDIARLVQEFEQDERDSVVLPLTVLDAGAVSELLVAVYSSGQRDWRGNAVPRPGQPKVVPDRTRNQLMVRGSQKQVDDIRAMLTSLGEPQLTPLTGADKQLLVLPLTSDSKVLMQAVQKFWPTLRPNNPIEIIELGKRSQDATRGPQTNSREPTDDPRRRELPPGVAPGTDGDAPSRPRTVVPPRNGTMRAPRPTVVPVSYQDPVASEKPAAQEKAEPEKAAPQEKGPPVVMSFGPDNVVIGSTDPEALQALRNLISTLTRGSTPGGIETKVYYLNAADATQMQQTLSDLLGVSSTSSMFGGSSSTSTSTLKIVTDTRTNSLIVFGSSNDHARITQLLEVLDRVDPPSSGALSAPRIIPVRYASAASVYRVIRDVYASRMATAGGPGGTAPQGFGGFSPFGTQGGAPSTGRTGSRSAGSLSLGVDEQSNSLVVSCSEATFQEVKTLVESLDLAANETQRTVEIVTIKNSTPTAVQEALNGLMGINSRTRSVGDTSSRGFGGFSPFGGGPGGGFAPMGGGFSPFGGFQGGGGAPGGVFFNRGGGGDRGSSRGGGGTPSFSPFGGFGGRGGGGDRRP